MRQRFASYRLRYAASVLVLSALCVPLVAHAASWSTTKVTAGNMGPYCAVSRKIDATTVTVGRTLRGESSLAVELGGVTLDPAKTYRVSMKPGSAERLEIETKPVNAKTFVLNVDKVVDLAAAFKTSPTLNVKYDDQSLALMLDDWVRGDQDLDACLASLSATTDKTASVSAKPMKIAKSSVGDIPTTPSMPQVNEGEAARVTALNDENRKLRDDVAALRNAKDQAGTAATTANSALQAQVKTLQDQVVMLQSTNQANSAESQENLKKANDQAMRLATLTQENSTLKMQLDSAQKATAAAKAAAVAVPVPAPTPVAPVDDAEKNALKAERDQLARDNTALQQQLTAQKSTSTDVKGLADEMARLRVEKGTLQTKLDAALAAPKKPDKPAVDVVVLQSRVDALESERDDLKSQLAAKADMPKPPAMAELQRRMEMMSAENVKLRADLATATTPDADMKATVAAEAPLRQQLRDMKADNQLLKAKNEELTKLLDAEQNSKDKELIGAAGKNWDLEQATRRLQESEREVQRLSIAMRDQKVRSDAEKKQIEYMLFDPKLAKDGQIALLNSLEDQIAELRANKGLPPTAHVTPVVTDAPIATAANQQPYPSVTAEPLAASADVANVAPVPGAAGFTSLLKQAGVTVTSALASIPKNPFGPGKAWRYEAGALAGLAVEQAPIKPNSFDDVVSRQMKHFKSACKGDFAAQPAAHKTTMGIKYASFDVACIAGDNSTSAAVLFYQKNGAFNVISHESAPDAMDKAMDARDKVITTLAGK